MFLFISQTFDRFRCARLVMECLCSFDDTSMNRMSVAICSILAAKVRIFGIISSINKHLHSFEFVNSLKILWPCTVYISIAKSSVPTIRDCFFFRFQQSRHLNLVLKQITWRNYWTLLKARWICRQWTSPWNSLCLPYGTWRVSINLSTLFGHRIEQWLENTSLEGRDECCLVLERFYL